jgi:hypothetical protein
MTLPLQNGHGPVPQFASLPVTKSPRRWSSWHCTISQSPGIKPRKGSPSVHKTLQKEPLQDPRKKEKVCWKCSQTFSFNDKWFCLPVGVLLFQLKGEPR